MEKHYCRICGREISKEQAEDYDGRCWEFVEDEWTEEESEDDLWEMW